VRLRGRRFGFVLVVALVLGPTAVIAPAWAASVPSAPAMPSASPGNGQARVTWTAPASNGSPINQYIVTPFIGFAAQTPRTFNSTAVTQLVTGLTNGTTYRFKVKAHNGVGTGTDSVASNAVEVGTPAAPSRPSTAPGDAQARLNWLAPANNGSPISGYVVTPFIGMTAKAPRTFNSTKLVQVVTGLTNGTAYTFKIAAKNAVGTGPQSAVSMIVKPTAQATLKVAPNATIGQPILVNSYGMTVYLFVPDGAGTTSMVHGALRTAWPYVTWSGPVTVGSGLTLSKAAANLQPDNSRLVGYNHHLLYTFVNDHAPGDVHGQGVANFFVVSAAGNKIP
jgi:predicted lipoprotein with Yx(FWY)xxD motif